MLRKLIFLGIAVGSAGAVPAVYQTNSDRFHELIRLVLSNDTPGQDRPQPTRVSASRLEFKGETSVLLGRKVRIAADARGHYMGRFKLNGREVSALVDTGATFIAINSSLARRIGLQLAPNDFKYEVSTANGKTRAAAVRIGTLQIGRIHVEDVEAAVLDDRALDGVLIGMSFLKRLSRYHVEGGALVLEQ
ncbi:TIGR02281 family clan AA aspartic protease [Nitratireductor sp. ZSWI3]|uniref:TIGR02281 family clan AA aspartic protease n=1 Tax=Nitratireductor sp. ZSWI3 TaxID=2966359 RepID=UPI0021501C5E|nr:TIGR02281 family clan AA aspartic protease [Nitratireductor sp. ZSWI3]MCR4266364.1 TIGR02281 family clan AA aspartic protease [Nitratireductor sp. ZSWI3]